jgi:hypothetical protein
MPATRRWRASPRPAPRGRARCAIDLPQARRLRTVLICAESMIARALSGLARSWPLTAAATPRARTSARVESGRGRILCPEAQVAKKRAVQARPEFREETPRQRPGGRCRRDISDVALHNLVIAAQKSRGNCSCAADMCANRTGKLRRGLRRGRRRGPGRRAGRDIDRMGPKEIHHA